MPASLDSHRPVRDIFTVSRLNREVRTLLEVSLPLIWVEGEISNLARPASGHLYFTLKDARAQIRCAMFRGRNNHLRFDASNGKQVLVRARVGLYEPRGDYQLIVEHMEEAGDGALRRAFEELKLKLADEGLFDVENKQPLPELPRCIGVVTSPSGAAIRDILTVLQRRFPAIPVIIYPVPVQGESAAPAIADAISRAGQRDECDVLIVGRGGGSLEDLWAFNEEVVARAIHACPVPVVSAVGHEVDTTIADFVADQRAATPSAAAELLSPDRDEWLAYLLDQQRRLLRCMRSHLTQKQQQLLWNEKRFRHPGRRLQENGQRLDEMEQRLYRSQQHRIADSYHRLRHLQQRLNGASPQRQLVQLGARCQQLSTQLNHQMKRYIEQQSARLSNLGRALDAVSPLATLQRGYAIVQKEDGQVIRHSHETQPGESIRARLASGQLRCRVEEINE